MTQEESLRDILNFILANPFDVHLIEEKAKLAMKLIDDNEQPIPQDINKWIEDEAEKIFPTPTDDEILFNQFYNENGNKNKQFWKIGANATAQLLLPELQQLRQKVGILTTISTDYHATIEQQKSQIDELKLLASERQNAVEELTKERNQFKEYAESKAAEIESLKQENERLKEWATGNGHIAVDIAAKVDYWKQRCEAAEAIIEGNEVWGNVIEWETWQTLKQQTHG